MALLCGVVLGNVKAPAPKVNRPKTLSGRGSHVKNAQSRPRKDALRLLRMVSHLKCRLPGRSVAHWKGLIFFHVNTI
jgi:hypothetical protein